MRAIFKFLGIPIVALPQMHPSFLARQIIATMEGTKMFSTFRRQTAAFLCAFFVLTAPAVAATVYGVILTGSLPEPLVTFSTSAPEAQTTINANTFSWFTYALAFDSNQTHLYAADTVSRLGTVDIATGAYTLLGNIAGILPNNNIMGMRTDPVSHTTYLLSVNGFSGATALYTLDLETRVATLVGTQTAERNLVDLAIDASGQLYTVGVTGDALYKLDKLTGQASLVGQLGIDIGSQQGLDFDLGTGQLYAALTDSLGAHPFGTIDPTTGVFSQAAVLPFAEKIAIQASIPEPNSILLFTAGFVGLIFASLRKRRRALSHCVR